MPAQTITAAFTAAQQASALLLVRSGEQFTYSLSGTYAQVVKLEYTINGGMTWVTLLTFSTADATATATITNDLGIGNLAVRWRCEARTSGTADVSLASVAEVTQSFRDADGVSVLDVVEGGVQLPGTLAVTGASTLTGAVGLGAALNEKHGADIASAATVNLDSATGNLVDITGTTTITAITLADGRRRIVRFTGALTLTHGASLVLPGGVNIVTVAGDFAVFVGYASGVVRCVSYSPVTVTGTGSAVKATSPTLVTPVLGVATATSLNKVAVTAPATAATLTIPDGVTLTGPAASGVAATLGNAETITGVKTFGAAGDVGKLKVAGNTSGAVTVAAEAVAGSAVVTLPAATDQLVGRGTTDTLTNKTLTAPTINGGTFVRTAQKRVYSTGAYAGQTAGWLIGTLQLTNIGTAALLPAAQTGSVLIFRVDGLKVGWTITGYHLLGQIESAGGAVTLDADLRKLTTAAADLTDASIGAITQIAVTADTLVDAVNSAKTLSTPEVVAADETYYLVLTGTTAALTDIALQGVALICDEA